MRLTPLVKHTVISAASAACITAPAFAGGFDRGGVNIDLLYDEAQIAAEATATYVFPQRRLDNVVRDVNLAGGRSEEHTSELQSHSELVCRLLLEKKKTKSKKDY